LFLHSFPALCIDAWQMHGVERGRVNNSVVMAVMQCDWQAIDEGALDQSSKAGFPILFAHKQSNGKERQASHLFLSVHRSKALKDC